MISEAMHRVFCLIILLSVFAFDCPAEDQMAEPALVISERGGLTLSDNSSFYTFRKDGTFLSGPWGMCGRTIEGKWRPEKGSSNRFIVEGRWSWVNGISPVDDYRRMVIAVYAGTFKKVPDEKSRISSIDEIFDCYFIIEELSPLRQP